MWFSQFRENHTDKEACRRNLGRRKGGFLQNEKGRETLSQMPLQSGWHVKDLKGGCICCSGVQLLAGTFFELVEEWQPDRIVLEAAETARIESFRMLLAQEAMKQYVLDHVLYVCNVKNYHKRMLISGNFFEKELKQAPVVFLNGMEELPDKKRTELQQELREINHDNVQGLSANENSGESE